MRVGSRSLGEFPLDVVRIGAAIALPDLLGALSSCERRADFSKPCGAPVRGPSPRRPLDHKVDPRCQLLMTSPSATICANGENFEV